MISLARFFIQAEQVRGNNVLIEGNDAHHITRVLRLSPGEYIDCVDTLGQTHRVRIQETSGAVRGLIEDTVQRSQESPVQLTLFQGLAKGSKMDLVVQKAVELGVAEIVPFSSKHTVVQLDPKQACKRKERWERIAEEAAKQCGRTALPTIHTLHSFADVVTSLKERLQQDHLVLLASEAERQTGLRSIEAYPQAVSVIVGPEGGFAQHEVEQLAEAGATVVTLGPRILRTETAGLVILSIVGYKWGDLG